jgi:trehalose-6-phosphatase
LDQWFEGCGVGLSAEHGCFYRHPPQIANLVAEENNVRPDCGLWHQLIDIIDPSWRDTIRPLLQHYTERTPGSFIEDKEVMLWLYIHV